MFAGLRSCTRSLAQSWVLRPRFQSYATSASDGYNTAIIDMLKKERETYSKEHGADGYKIRAFSNAIKAIEQIDEPIYAPMESSTVKGIGAGIAKRINKFLKTQHAADHPHAAQFETSISQTHAREQFLQIPGLGVKKVQQLLDAGCRSIAELRSRKYMHLISNTQHVFVKYMDHLNNPVTRGEAELVARFMQENLPSKYEIVLAGDYRRGLSSFPHIDIVVSHPKHVEIPIPDPPRSNPRLHKSPALKQKNKHIVSDKEHTNALLNQLLPTLHSRGLVCGALSSADKKWGGIIRVPELVEGNGSNGKEWRDKAKVLDDIAKLNGSFRRMNIVLTPQKARAATLFAMTGDAEFVKYVRYKALSLGLHLDDFGLWQWHSSRESAESTGEQYTPVVANEDPEHPGGYWELFKISTEEDIFSSLNMEYVQPHRRNFRYLDHGKRRAIL